MDADRKKDIEELAQRMLVELTGTNEPGSPRIAVECAFKLFNVFDEHVKMRERMEAREDVGK